MADGSVRWQKNLRSDFGGEPGKWAYSESPLVDGDNLVCTPGGTEATIVALDKKTGELIWKCAVPEGDEAGYASAIIVDAGGIKQYVQFLAKGLVGVDAKTGKFLWRYDKTAKGSPANIPTPVAQDALVYSGSNRGGGGLVELKVGGDGIEATEVYFGPKLPTSIGGADQGGRLSLRHQQRRADVRRVRHRRRQVAGPQRRRRLRSASPRAGCTSTAKRATSRWSKPRPKSTARRAASRRPISPTAASRKPGPIRSWPTAACTSATWAPCGPMT